MRIKICGLRRLEDTRLAVELGADYLGFVFAPSPRQIDPEQAGKIVRSLPKGIKPVGVFVNAGQAMIRRAVSEAELALIQLHGDESPELCREVRRSCGLQVIKAIRAGDEGALEAIARYETDYILLEPRVPGRYGGTGVQVDWSLAARIVSAFPQKRFFLAGGLKPENLAEAIRRVRPFAVDASSGLEAAKGEKDPEKMREFFKVVRSL